MCAAASKTFRNLEDFAGIASDWFWETDADHRFSYFSNRMEEITKFNSYALIGQKRDVIPNESLDDPKWIAHMQDLKAHRPFSNLEYQMRRPHDGTLLWIRVSGIPIFDADGTFAGYRGTGHDITEEKVGMARLEASNAALQMRNKQLDEARCALERSAFEDSLTNLWNRRAFERDLHNHLVKEDRYVGLLHIDLDRFKWVNDTLGHPAGDVVLQTAANRIRKATGSLGMVYRVGGDEFMVLLCENVNQDMARMLGHRVTHAMANPVPIGERCVTIGASIGIAFSQSHVTSPYRLITNADAALYEAKNRGRNAICMINDTIQNRIEQHRKLAADIPGALDRGEFVPYFQPQVNVRTREVIGVEALVRWQHPERGLLGPSEFLQVATELAIIDQIDRAMLQMGLAAIGRIKDVGFALPSLSINMSESRLADPRLLSDVGCLWLDHSCSLSFELLETIDFEDAGGRVQLHDNLQRIRNMGVSIETDDFGSGRASITSLLEVAPDRLKIDRGLIKEVVTSSQKRSMVRAILDMANALGIDCIAEGAETDEAIAAIRELGCDQVQGFAISHPLSEQDLIAFLARHPIASRSEPETKTAGREGLPKTA